MKPDRWPGLPLLIAAALTCAGSTVLAGCGAADDRSGDAAVLRRDSSGVAIVETTGPDWATTPAWTVNPEPELVIGVLDGADPYVFSSIAGAFRLDDGQVVVGDRMAMQIRYFDAAGRFVRSVGRQGQGPGEFRGRLEYLWHCGGDRIYAHDRAFQRISVWGAGGELRREFFLLQPDREGSGPYHTACSADGEFIVAGWESMSSLYAMAAAGRAVFYELRAPVWVLDDHARPLLTVGEFLISERIYYPGGSGPHPLGLRASLALGDERIYIGTGSRLEVLVYDRGGRHVGTLRGPGGDLAFDPALVERLVGVDQRNMARAEAGGLALPKQLPAFTDMRLDPDGNLWVLRYRWPGDPERWGVFAAAGQFLGHVEMPERFRLHQIGRDDVGVATGEYGVQRVHVHRLRRGAAGPAQAESR